MLLYKNSGKITQSFSDTHIQSLVLQVTLWLPLWWHLISLFIMVWYDARGFSTACAWAYEATQVMTPFKGEQNKLKERTRISQKLCDASSVTMMSSEGVGKDQAKHFCMIISRTTFFLKVVRKKQSGGPPKSLMCRKNIGVNVKKNLWKVSSTPKPILGMQKCCWSHKPAKTNKGGKTRTRESQILVRQTSICVNRGSHLHM